MTLSKEIVYRADSANYFASGFSLSGQSVQGKPGSEYSYDTHDVQYGTATEKFIGFGGTLTSEPNLNITRENPNILTERDILRLELKYKESFQHALNQKGLTYENMTAGNDLQLHNTRRQITKALRQYCDDFPETTTNLKEELNNLLQSQLNDAECTYQALFFNRDPHSDFEVGNKDSGTRLNQRDIQRHIQDITWNPPKDFTLIHNFADDETINEENGLTEKQRLESMLTDTVQEIMEELIEPMVQRRDNMGGVTKHIDTASMGYGMFLHHTTRPVRSSDRPYDRDTGINDNYDSVEDPHLHVHTAIFNSTRDPETGQYYAIELGNVMQNMPRFEAEFQNRLACKLEQAGYEISPRSEGVNWGVKNITSDMRNKFSNRLRNQIEPYIDRKEMVDDREKSGAGAATRELKESGVNNLLILDELWNNRLSREEEQALETIFQNREERRSQIMDLEQQIATTRGYNHVSHHDLLQHDNELITPHRDAATALDYVANTSFDTRFEVDRNSFLAKAMQYTLTGSYQDVVETLDEKLDDASLLIKEKPEILYGREQTMVTTRQAQDELHSIKNLAGTVATRLQLPLNPDGFTREDHTLSPLQEGAVDFLLRNPQRVSMLVGVAGAGKTYCMQQFRDAWQESLTETERENHQFRIFSPTNKLKSDLRNEFPDAQTIQGFIQDAKDALEKYDDETARERIYDKYGKEQNNIIVVDESTFLSNEDMIALLTASEVANFRVVLLYDDKQLGADGAFARGRPLDAMAMEGLIPFQLDETRRQQGVFKDILEEFRDLPTRDRAINRLDEHGCIHETTDELNRIQQISDAYFEAQEQKLDTMIIASSHREISQIGNAIEHRRRQQALDALDIDKRDPDMSNIDLSLLAHIRNNQTSIDRLEAPRDANNQRIQDSELAYAHNYRNGFVLECNRNIQGCKIGQRYTVQSTNQSDNTLTLVLENDSEVRRIQNMTDKALTKEYEKMLKAESKQKCKEICNLPLKDKNGTPGLRSVITEWLENTELKGGTPAQLKRQKEMLLDEVNAGVHKRELESDFKPMFLDQEDYHNAEKIRTASPEDMRTALIENFEQKSASQPNTVTIPATTAHEKFSTFQWADDPLDLSIGTAIRITKCTTKLLQGSRVDNNSNYRVRSFVRNEDRAITGIELGNGTVDDSNGLPKYTGIIINPDYAHFESGYAATDYQAQGGNVGETKKPGMVICVNPRDARSAYVGMSRLVWNGNNQPALSDHLKIFVQDKDNFTDIMTLEANDNIDLGSQSPHEMFGSYARRINLYLDKMRESSHIPPSEKIEALTGAQHILAEHMERFDEYVNEYISHLREMETTYNAPDSDEPHPYVEQLQDELEQLEKVEQSYHACRDRLDNMVRRYRIGGSDDEVRQMEAYRQRIHEQDVSDLPLAV